MKKACFLVMVCVFMLIIASIPEALCYPPAGFDTMDPTTATIELEIIGMFNETITAKGPTTVSRSNPYNPGDGRIKIDTEIVSMNLVGTSSYIGQITIVESPSKTSNGTVRQLSPAVDFPANSSFSVFVEIQTTLSSPNSILHNDDPVFMNAIIYAIPPLGSIYKSSPERIPLKNEYEGLIGYIKHVSHIVGHPNNYHYTMMGGFAKGCTHIQNLEPGLDWKTPFQTRPPYFTPYVSGQNSTFSDPWTLPGYGMIVNYTVPYQTYAGLTHAWYDASSSTWYRLVVTLEEDAHGWIFLNATGDVDSCTFNNYTGVYWGRKNATFASPLEGQLAADTGALPFPGPDGVPGTADDGFGDGKLDPRGSSILLIPSKMHVDFWSAGAWALLFDSAWPQVLTTGTAYDIVTQPTSELYNWNSTETGQPWEYFAGLDHPEYKVEYCHPKWNAYVTHVCAWSVLNYDTALGKLDVIFQIEEKGVRDDCVIADIDCSEEVDIVDIVICALAFGAKDEGPGPDGTPGTGDDVPIAGPPPLVFDARGDVDQSAPGEIDIVDIVKIALNFGYKLTPDCIQIG